jgi:cyclohexyl-isocyanide hydratase
VGNGHHAVRQALPTDIVTWTVTQAKGASVMADQQIEVGIVVFPDVTQLDFTGPLEVLSRIARCRLIWKTTEPVQTHTGFVITPDVTFDEVDRVDILLIPGGGGVTPLLEDDIVLREVRRLAATARYVTSVCTGSLVLGAAGLLAGKRATTHWGVLDILRLFGATPVEERVVIDGNLITGGGVTAGIDFGLTLAAELVGTEQAQAIQLVMEYNPRPPFDAGSPKTAPAETVLRYLASMNERQPDRLAIYRNAAQRAGIAAAPAA